VLLHSVGPRNADELNAAFAQLLKARPDALLVTAEAYCATFAATRRKISIRAHSWFNRALADQFLKDRIGGFTSMSQCRARRSLQ
jgi:hypothetical protein